VRKELLIDFKSIYNIHTKDLKEEEVKGAILYNRMGSFLAPQYRSREINKKYEEVSNI
jgi:hypothetical protein